MKQKTDEELVQLAIQDGNEFFQLMERYEKRLIVYIKRLSNISQEDAEDLLQEVFIKTYQNLHAFNPALKFSSWIYRIAHNEVIDLFRKNKNKPNKVNSEDAEIILEKVSSDLDLENELDKEMKQKMLKSIIEMLDEKYRDVLILKFIEDKDYEEISDILNKPMGTIATLINRAKAQLKKLLAKHGITSSKDI